MFLFCNFIIILIILDISKSGSEDESTSGAQQPMLISSLSSKSDFEKSKPSLTSKTSSQESELMSESFLSSKHTSSGQSLTCKPGLQIMFSGL
ncbi:unnamed protein product [Brassica rapa]|uniref:Uncharacterized protein n=2 Tax=Brassica campestris TaxID=3711 RepID=A0A8D9MEW1_BRACM|nr:unnamed protein product [Brassica rapa]